MFIAKFLFSFFLPFLFMAAPAVYGSSQARGQIGATAAGLYCSLWQCQVLVQLSRVRDWIPSSWTLCQIHNLLSHKGNSPLLKSWNYPMYLLAYVFSIYTLPLYMKVGCYLSYSHVNKRFFCAVSDVFKQMGE